MSAGEQYSDIALRAADFTRDEQRAIVSRITALLPNRADHMPVLQMLLAPMHPATPPHGNQHSAAWSQARTEWLDQVRAWVAGQGRVLASRNVGADDQRAYVQATGNHFQPPELPDRRGLPFVATSGYPPADVMDHAARAYIAANSARFEHGVRG